MTLGELFKLAEVPFEHPLASEQVLDLTDDSRKVGPGTLYLSQITASGAEKANLADAIARQALAGLAPAEWIPEGVDRAIDLGSIEAYNDAVWRLSTAWYGFPSRKMQVVGVTGTNGKTTTAWMMQTVLSQLGKRSAYLGTIGYTEGGELLDVGNTTPNSPRLQQLLASAVRNGVESLAIEVSSHSLVEKRVYGTEFDAAVFTNLTQDHLDFHKTMEAYEEAKFLLFSELPRLSSKSFRAALNLDDPVGKSWASRIPALTYGLEKGDLSLKVQALRVSSMSLEFGFSGETATVEMPIGGGFNASNALSAVAGILSLGYPFPETVAALGHVRAVPGRFEPVPNDLGFDVIVDFAHTPDALEKLLESVRTLNPTKVTTLFGCGGDRDRTKRPKMTAIAAKLSDQVILTADNPRTEDPDRIFADLREGAPNNPSVREIRDREEAIFAAVREAQAGEVVVIAGKGHEDYQLVQGKKLTFSDREVARRALESRS